MSTWPDIALRYVQMVRDQSQGFNHLAADVAEELLGRIASATVLDLGCGEGFFARHLATRGAHVTAVEPTQALLDAAIETERSQPLGIAYQHDLAEKLDTVAPSSFDAVAALLVMHHVEDLDAALQAVRRTLRAGGVFVFVVPHPLTDHAQAQWTETSTGPRRTIGSYTDERFWQADDSGALRAVGWYHRTLATWCNSLIDHAFIIERVREPVGHEHRRADHGGPWQNVPRFLAVRSRAS